MASVPAPFLRSAHSQGRCWSGHVTPRLPSADFRDGAFVDLEGGCDHAKTVAAFPSVTDRWYIRSVQLGKTVGFPASDKRGFPLRPVSITNRATFRMEPHSVLVPGRSPMSDAHVLHVVGVRTKLQMVWPDALLNVALVQNHQSTWDRAVGQFPSDTVGWSSMAGDLDHGVPVAIPSALEQPASIPADDLSPETIRPRQCAMPNTHHVGTSNCHGYYSRNARRVN